MTIIKPILVIATAVSIALVTTTHEPAINETTNSIDSLIAQSKTSCTKANNSIAIAEKVQKENLKTLKDKVATLETEKKMLILKLEKNVESPNPVDSVEQFDLFSSN